MVIKDDIADLNLETEGDKTSNINNEANEAGKANNWLIPRRLGMRFPF